MPTFPIPVFVACVLAFASLRLYMRQGQANALVLLLLLCAVQSLIIALSQHYGVEFVRVAQPFFASLIPPAAWIAFDSKVSRTILLHALGPLLTVAALLVSPQFIDVLLPGLFAFYGGLILVSAKDGADAQPDTRLSSGDLPAQIWLFIGVALVASALSDVLIVAALHAGYPELRPWIISIFSVGNLLIIGALSFSQHLQTVPDREAVARSGPAVADPEIWQRLQTFMEVHKPYLDPDLTLSRLSRKVSVPTKVLSATINQATGENVSRYINTARVSAAQAAMLDGETVTSAMLMSGFNTKSNFNREFLRVVGANPTTWLTDTKKSDQS